MYSNCYNALYISVSVHWCQHEPCPLLGTCSNYERMEAPLGKEFARLFSNVTINQLSKLYTFWQIYWVGPLLGGIIGGFTYEYTHDSSDHLQYLRRSFRRKRSSVARPNSLKCSSSITSTLSTEMTYTPKSEDLRIWRCKRQCERILGYEYKHTEIRRS